MQEPVEENFADGKKKVRVGLDVLKSLEQAVMAASQA